MTALFGQAVFKAGGRSYAWEDVVLAAIWWGDWDVLEAQARQGLACAGRLEAGDGEHDPGQVSAAADEFRYERDLLTVEETEAWLARWGLTTESWMDFIERSVLRRAWADALDDIVREYPVDDDDVDEAIHAEGVCSGTFAGFAWKLAGRAAAFDRAGPPPAARAAPGEGQEEKGPLPLNAAAARAAARGLAGVPAHVCRRIFRDLAHIDRAFHQFSRDILSPKAIRDAIATHRLDWIELHCRTASFGDPQAAREAALCVREDRNDLAAVARAARTDLRDVRFYLDDTEPTIRDALQSARRGDLLGPLPAHGTYALFQVLEKVLPSPEDPQVRLRAERDVLDRAVAHEITNRVRWQFPL